jgi:hypothetical protein
MKPAFNPQTRPLPVSSIELAEVARWQMEKNKALPMIDRDKHKLMVDNWASLDLIARGAGLADHMAIVITAMNMAMVLTEQGFGREYQDQVRLALDGCWRAKKRGDATGRWVFDGPALVAVREAMQVLEAQIDHASRYELIDVIHTIHARHKTGNVYCEAA